MKCPHCGGTMNKGAAPFHADRKGYHLTLDSVPAWVCTQCGEALFEAPQVEAIQDALRSLDQKTAGLAVA